MKTLNEEDLKRVLSIDSTGIIQKLEDSEIEFKRLLEWHNSKSQSKYLKELVALSNSGGGYLIFGVDDDTNEAVGIDLNSIIDLKNITDQLQKYFAPSFDISAMVYELNSKKLFVIYANESSSPVVCIKDGAEVTNGILYWRYSGKSEPIKGADMLLLLDRIKQTPTAELLNHNLNTRRIDILPKFMGESGMGRSPVYDFKCNMKNIGGQAQVVAAIADASSEVPINPVCNLNRFINKDETWHIFGKRLFGEKLLHAKYKFRLYYKNVDGDLYYQEFEGKDGVVSPYYVDPIPTTVEELELYKSQEPKSL